MIEVYIRRWGTGFSVRTISHQYLNLLRDFNDKLTARKMQREHGKIIFIPGDKFFLFDSRKNEYLYAAGAYDRLMQHVENNMYQIRDSIKYHYETVDESWSGDKVEFDRNTFKMHEEHEDFVWQNDAQKAGEKPTGHDIFEVQMGKGKAAKNGTLVRIPGGWKAIEKLKIGDTVTGADGKPTLVTGVYPQGVVDLYEVTFYDGRKATVCGEHLWQCFYINTTEKRRWGVRNTLEMKRLLDMHEPRVYIPLPEPEETSEKDFPIHPYLLGVLLGDGSMSTRALTITKYDTELIDRVRRHLPEGCEPRSSDGRSWRIAAGGNVRNPLVDMLDELKLIGTRSDTKFIPKQYLEGSVEQRWELLRGLMDTDGTVGKYGGQPSFCSTSYSLALGVQELVRSLGGVARLSEKRPHYTYKGEYLDGKLAYNVLIRMKKPSMLFHLTRKKQLTNDHGQYNDILKLRVKSIESVESGEATCISVDNQDKLFVMDQWIVTHNTVAFCKIAKILGERTMLITKPAFVEKWKKDFKEALDFRPGELLVIEDFDDLEDLMQVAKEGGLKAGKGRREVKMILTGSFVIDNYIKRYCEGERFLYSPYELLKALGVGMLGYDEVHMLFRMNYQSYIMLAPKKVVDLSATLVPDQDFNKARYKERFPEEFRFKMEYDKYINVVSVYYNWGDRKTLRRINGMKMYSHNELEKIIMRNPKQQKSYFDMLYKLMERWYFEKHAKGHKCLIIFGMKEICTRFVQYVKLKHPNFDVARYIDGDDYNKAGKADIIVSTRGKSGTAVDYKGLTMALITTAVDDSQANLQMMGRTRKGVLRDWGITPHVVYPVCRHFNKHVKYYRNRMESFSGKVASAVTMNSSFII